MRTGQRGNMAAGQQSFFQFDAEGDGLCICCFLGNSAAGIGLIAWPRTGAWRATCGPHHGCEQVRRSIRADRSRVDFLQAAASGAEAHEAAKPQTERGARLHCVITCMMSVAVMSELVGELHTAAGCADAD